VNEDRVATFRVTQNKLEVAQQGTQKAQNRIKMAMAMMLMLPVDEATTESQREIMTIEENFLIQRRGFLMGYERANKCASKRDLRII
jgi:hypothetical protein